TGPEAWPTRFPRTAYAGTTGALVTPDDEANVGTANAATNAAATTPTMERLTEPCMLVPPLDGPNAATVRSQRGAMERTKARRGQATGTDGSRFRAGRSSTKVGTVRSGGRGRGGGHVEGRSVL